MSGLKGYEPKGPSDKKSTASRLTITPEMFKQSHEKLKSIKPAKANDSEAEDYEAHVDLEECKPPARRPSIIEITPQPKRGSNESMEGKIFTQMQNILNQFSIITSDFITESKFCVPADSPIVCLSP